MLVFFYYYFKELRHKQGDLLILADMQVFDYVRHLHKMSHLLGCSVNRQTAQLFSTSRTVLFSYIYFVLNANQNYKFIDAVEVKLVIHV